jgi:uncharacterized protein
MQHKIIFSIIGFLIISGLLFIIPWRNINWGKISYVPAETITVIGEASSNVSNQVATFTAGVSSVNDDKDSAVNDVNSKVTQLIKSVKDFGIADADIKTQNISLNQMDEQYYDNGVQKSRPGQWRVSNDVEITLREVGKASDLANVLSQSGATNVWGPNFSLNDVKNAQADLLAKAIADAKNKATKAAIGSSRKLGKILTVTEGNSTQNVGPFYAKMEGMGGGGGSPVETGTGEVTQTVTVVFEMK